jgi:4-amino-4-deoxy-L-arabinose transferase-like glycosyltransferase
LAILLLAFALRCGGLDSQELRGDEAFGYFLSLHPLDEIVEQTLDLHEPHPVASYWLQHLWLAGAGHSEFALRFSSVWWSVMAVALIVALAAHLALPSGARLMAAALMALSPYVIWHAQDARMYSMSLALTLLSTLLAVLWWQGEGRWRQLWYTLGYLLMTWLALHTHYFVLYVVVAQNLALVGWAIVEHSWRKLVMWWGVSLALLLLWLPWLWVAWSILLDYHGNGDSPRLLEALIRAHSAFGVGEAVASGLRPWMALLTLAAMALGALALWWTQGDVVKHRRHMALWFLLVYWLVPLAATWLSAQNRPIFNERYLVAAVPPIYLLMAAVVHGEWGGAERRAWVGRGVLVLVVVGMVFGLTRQMSDPQYSKTRGWRELAAMLETLAAGVDPARVRLVQNYPDPTLWYYYQGDVAHLVLPPAPNDPARTVEEVERLVAERVERVILVEQPSDAWDANSVATDALSARYTLVATTNVARWPLSIWLHPPAGLAPVQVDYEGGLKLSGALVVPTELSPGGMVEVYLRWQGNAGSVGEQEAVSLQLLNGAGELVTQSDQPLAMASVTTAQVASYVILVPPTLASGEYECTVVVYDAGGEGGPRRLTLQGADRYRLATLRVRDLAR